MSDSLHLADFLEPVKLAEISNDEPYHDGQVGNNIVVYDDEFPDLLAADVVIIGCAEQRGRGPRKRNNAPDVVRREFYRFYNWHASLKIADAGNIRSGADLDDTYAALKTVVRELTHHNKAVVIIGGTHDLTLAQYYAHADDEKIIEAVCVDAKIDLDMNSPARNDNFLMEMLTSEPNFIRHYNHIGFQSYLVHPHMLETLDKLRFDCYRVGKVRENVEEMEPVVRNADIFSFDISAVAHAYAPSNTSSPNGFTGDEACALLRYAGLAPAMTSVGIYGYDPEKDRENITAKQIGQMLWYFIDGKSRGTREARIHEKEAFNEYHTAFNEVATTFLQSKRTGRWWMQLPDQQYIACSYNDYIQASSNEIPERWLRAQERSS
ncbi:MAG: formimidoylglutamase [Chitinophagaceae bacterium]|nr:formimidoylglutamase [Chitinophagaceae bacterium]